MYSYGDIVVLPFSYTDLASSKRRPALVLLNTDDGDLLVARITSKEYRTAYDIPLIQWSSLGLLVPSFVRLHKLLTIEATHVHKSLGSLEPMEKDSIRSVFGTLI
jgi:mRNA interferase MazF